MGTRRTGRETALRILYQWDLNREELGEVLRAHWEADPPADEAREFAERLAREVVSNKDRIDGLISKHAKNWRLERMETVDRNVLRLAVAEMLMQDGTPASVIINEAIEIARRYSVAGSGEFVNGLLDSIRIEIASGG
jgi:transcription antitermination protein NusB